MSSADSALVRPTAEADIDAIAGIYEHYVRTSAITFHTEAPPPDDWRQRFRAAQEKRHPWLVSELDGAVAGFAYASSFRPRQAYALTTETTVYLHPDAVGRGLGRPLYERLLGEASERDFHLAVAGITLPNAASVAVHEAVGFEPVGVFREVGHKFGAWHDVAWWQRAL